MTAAARDVLRAFEALSPAEQQKVAAQILRRAASDGEPPGADLDELAAEVLRLFDVEEAARRGA
jgi:hypothetical protein